jgi:hypothetical protein
VATTHAEFRSLSRSIGASTQQRAARVSSGSASANGLVCRTSRPEAYIPCRLTPVFLRGTPSPPKVLVPYHRMLGQLAVTESASGSHPSRSLAHD